MSQGLYMSNMSSRFALLGGGVRARVWIREQRKINSRVSFGGGGAFVLPLGLLRILFYM